MTGSTLNQKFIKNLNAIGYEVEKNIVYKTIFKKKHLIIPLFSF